MSNLKNLENGLKVKDLETVKDLAILNIYDIKYNLNVEFAFTKEERQKIIENYDFNLENDYKKNKVIKDFEIVQKIKSLRETVKIPIVGDYVIQNNELKRIAINIGDNFQFGSLVGSYHISKNGYASYSGSCYEAFDPNKLELIGNKPAYFWIWHNGNVGADQSIDVIIPVKVWKLKN